MCQMRTDAAVNRTHYNGSVSSVARNFIRGGGGHNFAIFFKRIFFGRTNLRLIEKQKKTLGESGGMLPR